MHIFKIYTLFISIILSAFLVGCSSKQSHEELHQEAVQAQADADGELIQPMQAKLVDNMGQDESTLTNGVVLAMPAMTRGQTINTITWVVTFEEVVFKRETGGDYDNL